MRASTQITAVALVLAGLVAAGPCQAGERTVTTAHRRVADHSAFVVRPADPNGRLVIYVHGSGERPDAVWTDPLKRPITRLLARRGYTVAAVTAGPDTWGNPASVAAQRDLYDAVAPWRKRAGVFVWAQSMGGTASLLALRTLPDVKAWAGVFPMCNLASMYGTGLGRDEPIRRAYGGTDGDVRVALPVRSPAIPAAQVVQGLPMLFWASPGDTLVPKASNTDRCAALAEGRGARVRVVTTSGEHGDPSNFDRRALLAFFGRAA